MKRSADSAREFGHKGEQVVIRLLKRLGFSILPAGALDGSPFRPGGAPMLSGMEEAVIAPDLIAVEKGATRTVEVKTKSTSDFYGIGKCQVTGLALRHWDNYLAFEAKSGLPGWIVFLHAKQDEVLGAPIAVMDPHKRVARDAGTLRTFNEPMVFFRCEDIPRMGTISEVLGGAELIVMGTSKEPRPLAVSTRWLTHGQIEAVAMAHLQRGLRDATEFALTAIRAKGASEAEAEAARRLIEQRLFERRSTKRLDSPAAKHEPRARAAAEPSGRVRTTRELTWRIDGSSRTTPAGLTVPCYDGNPADGVRVSVLGGDRWIRPGDLEGLDPGGTRAIVAAMEPPEAAEEAKPRPPIADAQLFADSFFKLEWEEGEQPYWPDDRMLEECEKRGALLMPSGAVITAKPGSNTYEFRRAFYYWIRTSAAGQEWAAAARQERPRADRIEYHPAPPATFSRIPEGEASGVGVRAGAAAAAANENGAGDAA